MGFRVLGFRVLLRAKPEHANSKMSILRGAYMKARASGLDDKVIDYQVDLYPVIATIRDKKGLG